MNKIGVFLDEFHLSPFAKKAALFRIRKMAGDKNNVRALGYVLQQVSGLGAKAHTQGFSQWQMGCPQRIPKLRSHAFWEGDTLFAALPWISQLEANFSIIKSELLALKATCAHTTSGFQPYRSPTWSSQVDSKIQEDPCVGAPAHDAGEWNVFYLCLHNVDFEANRSRCPQTVELLKSFGRSYGHAFFSAMAPHTHIVKHNGPTNKKLRIHFPLVIPKNAGKCRIRVGSESRNFIEGKVIVFDDSFEHEAWNDTSESRINLIFDIWHPDLTQQEVKFFEILRNSQMRAEKKATENVLLRRGGKRTDEIQKQNVDDLCSMRQKNSISKNSDHHPNQKSQETNTKMNDTDGTNTNTSNINDTDACDNLYAIIEKTRNIRPDEKQLWA
eukprot:GSMAST32.ASY1.ANO1.1372.1 assembled CDS